MSGNAIHLTLVLELSDPYMVLISNRTIFNETV